MMKEREPAQADRQTCPSCGGTGQLGFFGGVSRFVMSWEECFECCGTGYVEIKKDNNNAHQESPEKKQ